MDIFIPAFHHQLGPKCAQSIIDNGILNSGCADLLISKVIGLLIIAFSLVFKLPQIYTIIQGWSGKGINLSSLMIETGAITIIIAYCTKNLQSFTTFGDAVFVLVQNSIILGLIFFVSKQYTNLFLAVFTLLTSNYLLHFYFTKATISYLLFTLMPFALLGAVPQMWQNFKSKSIGQLSPTTIYLGAFNAFGRVITNFVEVEDKFALYASFIGTFINAVLVYQALAYSTSAPKINKAKKSS